MSSILDGTHNTRDLGNLPLTDGGTTRPGVLFRSDSLDKLTAHDVGKLDELRVGSAIDLRTDSERHRSPDAIPADSPIRLLTLPMLGGAMDELAAQFMPSGGQPAVLSAEQVNTILSLIPSLEDLYLGILSSSAQSFATIARTIVEQDSTDRPGVIFHCTAGKDRTGLAAALLLSLAGVEREAIVADYTQTAANLAGPLAEKLLGLVTSFGLPDAPQLRTLTTESPAHAIETALAWVTTTHGDAATYLASGGLTPDETERVRAIIRGEG